MTTKELIIQLQQHDEDNEVAFCVESGGQVVNVKVLENTHVGGERHGVYYITSENIRDFIINYRYLIDMAKVEKDYFIDILAGLV